MFNKIVSLSLDGQDVCSIVVLAVTGAQRGLGKSRRAGMVEQNRQQSGSWSTAFQRPERTRSKHTFPPN